MGKERTEDPAMRKVRRLWEGRNDPAGAGREDGRSPASARQAVSQFLKSGNPQIGMLRRFAKAMGVKVDSLI